jgi:hypothetical protein
MTRTRLALLIVLGTVMGVLIGLFAQPATPAPDPPPSPWDKHLLDLDEQAVDAAYVEHIKQLFEVWMKDAQGQPERAVSGARRARRAYIGVMMEIEKRKAAANAVH